MRMALSFLPSMFLSSLPPFLYFLFRERAEEHAGRGQEGMLGESQAASCVRMYIAHRNVPNIHQHQNQ